MGGVKNNNQQAKGASKVGSGWQESTGNHTTTTACSNEQQECAANDEGGDKEGEGDKGNVDGNEGVRQQRGQGKQGP
jgi:hypothetical protein